MSVLDDIISGVRADLALRRVPLATLFGLIDENDKPREVLRGLRKDGVSLIAEVKRSSPSKGALAEISDPAQLARIYEKGGASLVSVLTERRRFGGSLEDLVAVREAIALPILRKDFMVDEYQFYEARAYGADVVLLIVAALSQRQLSDYFALANSLGLKSIIEVHSQDELQRAIEIQPEIIGVNSRNLKDLSVDPHVFKELIPRIPNGIVRVAESGISRRADVQFAEKAGADAVLVGEALVKGTDPIKTIHELLHD